MKRRELSVDVGRLHGVGIHYRQVPDACTAQHLGSIRSYASQPDYQDMGTAQSFHFFFSQQQFRTLLPVYEFFLNHL